MTDVIGLIGQAFGLVFGMAMVWGLLYVVYKGDAIDWEQLAAAYAGPWRPPLRKKRFANMVLYSEGRPAKPYKGVVSIGLHANGVAFRPNSFLVPFQVPIFIPYEDIRGWRQHWYIDAPSAEVSFRRTPHMRMIMPKDQMQWMLQYADGAAQVSDERPPHGSLPWRTWLLAAVFGVWGIGLLIMVLVGGFPNDQRNAFETQTSQGPRR